MAFAYDTYTEASTVALTSHTSDSGHTYTGAGEPDVIGGAGVVRPDNNAGEQINLLSATPPSADYIARALGHINAANANLRFGVVARDQGDGNRYEAILYGDGNWTVQGPAGEITGSQGLNPITYSAGADVYVEMDLSGDTMVVTMDGNEVFNGTDTQVSLAGSVGTYLYGITGGVDYAEITEFSASATTSGVGPNLESAVADMTAIRATSFTYDFTSHFSDTDSIAYTITGAPSGWSLDASAGTVTYTHVDADVSNSPFTPHIVATDTEGNATTDSFVLTVVHPKMAFEVSAGTELRERSDNSLLTRTLHYQIMGQADPVGYTGEYDTGSATFASGEYTFTLTKADISAGEQGAIVLYDPSNGDTRRYITSAF